MQQNHRLRPLAAGVDRAHAQTVIALLCIGGTAWLLATASLQSLWLAFCLLAGAFVLLRHPWLIWPALGFALPVSSGIKFGPLSVTDLLLAIACILWFADGVRRRTLRLQSFSLLSPLAFYGFALYVSSLGASNLGEAGIEMVKWLEFGVVLLLAPSVLTPRQAPWLVAALLAGGISQGLLGLYQFVNGIGPEWFVILGRFMRASGSFRQPNPYAGYLGLTLPVAASLTLWGWRRVLQAPDRGLHEILWTTYYSAATVIIAVGILASWSRGAWLGAVAGVAVVVVLRSRRAAAVSGSVLVAVSVAIFLGSVNPQWIPAPIAKRLQDIPATVGIGNVLDQPLTDDNFAVVERIAHWVAALRMWEGAPWLGVGPGNYATVYPTVRLPLWEDPLGHAHNIYLNVLAETGLLGLVAYLTLWICVALWVWRRFQCLRLSPDPKANDGWFAALALGLLGVVVHLSVHNFFDNLFVQGMFLHIGLWLAALSVTTDKSKRLRRQLTKATD